MDVRTTTLQELQVLLQCLFCKNEFYYHIVPPRVSQKSRVQFMFYQFHNKLKKIDIHIELRNTGCYLILTRLSTTTRVELLILY